MNIVQGTSAATCGTQAVQEAVANWSSTPDIVFVFCSATQNPQDVVQALNERFPDVVIAGCTTSGEHLNGQHFRNAVVVTGVCNSGIEWATRRVQGLAEFTGLRAETTINGLFADLGTTTDDVEPDEFFSMLFIDGLSAKEESVTALIDSALCGINMAGGSAGDDLAFSQTQVLHADGASTDAFVLVMGKKNGTPVEIMKHQHFIGSNTSLVITKADPTARRVYEIDGYPATTAYAAAIGRTPEELDSDATFLHPLTLGYKGELYVRSIQTLHDDGSITFFCAIEEGMVLDIGSHTDMASALANDLEALQCRMGNIPFLFGFNCILRAIEADGAGAHERLGQVFKQSCDNMIGFDTYGEQLDGLHMNQTLVAVAFGEAT